MTVSYAIKDLPASAADTNLDLYGYDAASWHVIQTEDSNPRRTRKVFQLDGASRQFPTTMERSSDRTQLMAKLPAVKAQVQIIAPVTATDSETTLEVGAGQCRTWIGFHVTDVDAITPAMIVKQLLATLDALMPTITAGAADPGVISSLMTGNVGDLG